MNFKESELYLLSLGNEVSAMKLGLDNIRTLLAELGDPQKKYLKVQVAGTNGKGSVCAFVDAICLAAGIRTGVFTSPHLVSVTERIRISGKDISEEGFASFATLVRSTSERLLESGELRYRPTFFEQVTAIALLAFADTGVELAILETGLGGRFDATTAAGAEIAAITRIDLDHQEYLGNTIEEIAGEKAAIIHAGSKVAVAEQSAEAATVIQQRLDTLGLAARFAGQVRTSAKSGRLNFETGTAEYEVRELGLKGDHQTENAKLAIVVAELLQDQFSITTADIVSGLANARHPGRLELHGRFLFDGAHNPAGARALRAYLDKSVSQPITMIFGAMQGKDITEIAEALFDIADKLILTQPSNSRAMTAGSLAKFAKCERDGGTLFIIDNVADAIETAENVTHEEGVILVTGSLYLVGEAKSIINARAAASDRH